MLEHEKKFEKLAAGAVDEDGRVYNIDKNDENKVSFTYQNETTIIGKLMVGKTKLLYYKFEDERNVFRKTEAWSVNYEVFKVADYIVYETRLWTYRIPKLRAIEFGEILKFPPTEKKIYIPIKYWEKRHNGTDATENRRRNLLGDSWYQVIGSVINSDYMSKMGDYLRTRRKQVVVYPAADDVFRAYKMCSFEQTKVIILGQDPYHDGSANGLAFGFRPTSQLRPAKSLTVIQKEMETDVYGGFNLNFDETLERWAEQGVLLLNTHLTVEKGAPLSHQMIGWKRFTKIVLYELLKDPAPKVFMLWGNSAQGVLAEVKQTMTTKNVAIGKHLFLEAKHPASDLYKETTDVFGNVVSDYPRTFTGSKHFSQCNAFLKINRRKEIVW